MSKRLDSGTLRGMQALRPAAGFGRDAEDSPRHEPPEAHARPAGHGPTDRQRTARGGGVAALSSRSPRTRELLGRLRRELAKISPPPGNPEQALAEIALALTRANLADWAAPLYAPENRSEGPDDSVLISLVAHQITLEQTGSFSIVDLHPPRTVYFAMQGRGKARRIKSSTAR